MLLHSRALGLLAALHALFWLVAGSGVHAATPAAGAGGLTLSQVAPGVFVHFGRVEDWLPENGGDVANIGFIVGTRCVAVVDSGGTPDVGAGLRAAVERTTSLPVCYVINTHVHPDHVLGDIAFASPSGAASGGTAPAAPPTFVASRKFAAALAARERYIVNVLQRDFGIAMPHESFVYPTMMVDATLKLDLGGRVLQLNAWPTAHTDNDLTVYDRSTRTFFLSDLLFVEHLPVVDGSLRGWLSVMNDLERFDVALAVPGHGAASKRWPGVMAAQRSYLTTLLGDTRAALKRKHTLQQTVDEVAPPPSTAWKLVERFHRRNVTAAYAELEWEE